MTNTQMSPFIEKNLEILKKAFKDKEYDDLKINCVREGKFPVILIYFYKGGNIATCAIHSEDLEGTIDDKYDFLEYIESNYPY